MEGLAVDNKGDLTNLENETEDTVEELEKT